jgi:O-antigen/teichoic acid export membrane protein
MGSEPRPRKAIGLRANAAANASANVLHFAVIFLLTPVAVEHLGPEGWGVWQLVGAATALATLLDLGLGTATQYQVSFQVARGDHAHLAAALNAVRSYQTLAAGVLLSVLLVAGRPLTASLVEPAWVDVAHRTLAVTWVVTCLALPFQPFTSVVAGLQRYDLQGAFRAGTALLLGVAVLIGFERGMDLPRFAVLMSIGAAIPAFASWIAARRLLPSRALRFQRIDVPHFGSMVRYSLSTLLFTGGSVALYQCMRLVASWRCGGPEAAGMIGLAISVVQVLSVVFMPLLGVLLSRAGQLHGEGRVGDVAALLARALSATGLVVVPLVVFLALAADGIFEAWIGPAVGPAAVSQLAATARLMLIGQGAYVLALPCYYSLLGVGEHRLFGLGMLGVGVLNAALGWWAAGWVPRIETLGLVFGVLLALLAGGVVLPAALSRFSLRPGPLLARATLLPLAVATPGALAIQWRPRLGRAIPDLILDAVVFALLCLPGVALGGRGLLATLGPWRAPVGTGTSR